jgi:hypothetical protein
MKPIDFIRRVDTKSACPDGHAFAPEDAIPGRTQMRAT